MMIPVKALRGVGLVPRDRTSASRWLRRAGVPLGSANGNGGLFEYVLERDLPAEVQRAWELRRIEEAGLPAGDYDAAAHERFAEATPGMQEEALRKAELARFLLAGSACGGRRLTCSLVARAQAKFGKAGADKRTLRRILEAVEGVDPVNFAPALLPNRVRVGSPPVETSGDAWGYFLKTICESGRELPLRQAWRDTRDVAGKRGWVWPSLATVWRRWDALSQAQKLEAREGREAAIRRLAMPASRNKATICSLEWVSLDGRTLDFWVDFGDGKPARPVMLALVDVASNLVLGWRIERSENAAATLRLIRDACKAYGIFDRLYTDNGSAFAGHLVAGGAKHKFRGKKRAWPAVQPPGVCHHLGIDIHFALPANGQAKIAERAFAALSRVIDDRPEFNGAHAGHKPGASPSAKVRPVPLADAEAVIRREIDRHNREAGRSGQGACGRSYEQMFWDGLAGRITRKPTAQQLYHAGLVYSPASVDRWGRLHVGTWTYGDPETRTRCCAGTEGPDSDWARS